MKCENVSVQLPSLWENSLEPALAEDVRRHLDHCKTCREEWKHLGALLAEIEAVEKVPPSHHLRENFYLMLEEAKADANLESVDILGKTLVEPIFWKYMPWAGSIAAGLALLLGGFWIGRQQTYPPGMPSPHTETAAARELESLQGQIESMKEMMAVYMMDQRSASKRIQAVSYTDEISELSPELFEALLQRLNQDENVNVRLASLNALTRFTRQENVRAALVDSLPGQTHPVMQILLINLMVDMDEKRARGPLQLLLDNAATPLEVKDKALKGLGQLL